MIHLGLVPVTHLDAGANVPGRLVRFIKVEHCCPK